MNEDVDVFLAHHGVKGMKWGRRKDRRSKGRTKSGKKKSNLKRLKDTPAVRRREEAIKTLSNQELQERITRLNLENQYRKLNQTHSEKAKNWMKKKGANFLGQQMDNIAREAVKAGVNKAFKK